MAARSRTRSRSGAPGAAVGPATPATTGAIVGDRLRFPTASFSYASLIASQIQHTAPTAGDISNLVFTDAHWFLNTSFSVSALTPQVTFRKFVEYPQNTFTPILYSGTTNTTMALAQPMRTSDVLAITIPAGATWWEHIVNMSGASASFCSKELPTTGDLLGVTDCKYTAGAGGTPAHQAAADASARSFGSVLITGTIAGVNGAKRAFVQGDSIAWGQGDVTGSGVRGGSGYPSRKMDALGVPYALFARMGMSAFDLVALAAGGFTATFDAYIALINASASHVINEYGVNDLRLGRTKSQLLADYQTIYGKFPGKQIVQTTLTPRSTSGNGWTDEAGQAAQTDGNWAALASTNGDIRTGLANVATVMEVADTAMTARDSGIWKSSPTIGFVPTLDGTHPTSTMADYLSTNTPLTLA